MAGVDAQLQRTAATILEESIQARRDCIAAKRVLAPPLVAQIERSFADERLITSARQAVQANLSSTQLDDLLSWMNSELGRQVRHAEQAAGELDEAGFEQARKAMISVNSQRSAPAGGRAAGLVGS